MEEYKESQFRFSNPRIKKLSFRVSDNFDSSKYNGVGIKYEVTNRTNINDADVDLTVMIGKNEETVPFMIEATVTANFTWNNGLSDEQVQALLEKNAKVLLLSYLRPFISHLTVDAGYLPLFLPFSDFSESE